MKDRFVLPEAVFAYQSDPEGLDTPYWEGLQTEEIRVQRCNDCRQYQWGPEWICHHCQSMDLGYDTVEPRGTIFSWNRVWHPGEPAVAPYCPYIVLLVELASAPGIRLLGNLVGSEGQRFDAATAEVRIGATVVPVFEHHKNYTFAQWRVVNS